MLYSFITALEILTFWNQALILIVPSKGFQDKYCQNYG